MSIINQMKYRLHSVQRQKSLQVPTRPPHHHRSASTRIAGIGMVEVLVAVVVIGIGMLGIASLYVTTLQAKTTSLSRFQAITLASDIADRIRANRTAESDYDTTTATPADNSCAAISTTATACSSAQLAANDLWQWNNEITSTLPGSPTGKITVIPKVPTGDINVYTPAIYTITIKWSEPTNPGLSYTLVVQI